MPKHRARACRGSRHGLGYWKRKILFAACFIRVIFLLHKHQGNFMDVRFILNIAPVGVGEYNNPMEGSRKNERESLIFGIWIHFFHELSLYSPHSALVTGPVATSSAISTPWWIS
jgi:hypothetical protein